MRSDAEKTIWIDIDDTIAVTWPIMLDCAMNYCKEKGLNPQPDFNVECEDDLYFADILHLPDEHLACFFSENYPDYLTRIEPACGAKEFLMKLRQYGYKINLISARREKEGQIEHITRAWLNDNNLPYDRLVVNVKDKASYLISEKGFFIDDSYSHCASVNKKTTLRVIQKRSPFGKVTPEVFQGYVWSQIFDYILMVEK